MGSCLESGTTLLGSLVGVGVKKRNPKKRSGYRGYPFDYKSVTLWGSQRSFRSLQFSGLDLWLNQQAELGNPSTRHLESMTVLPCLFLDSDSHGLSTASNGSANDQLATKIEKVAPLSNGLDGPRPDKETSKDGNDSQEDSKGDHTERSFCIRGVIQANTLNSPSFNLWGKVKKAPSEMKT